MSVTVEQTTSYYAECDACGWIGQASVDYETAEEDAKRHLAHFHPSADAESRTEAS